ncbi:MAG TPA: HAD family phosphatase [Opitutaceae bacterium]
MPPTTSRLGVIFDWDGVVIDSSRQHEESWERLAREEGRTLPPGHFKAGFGKKNDVIIPQILGWTEGLAEVERLSRRKEALYREVVRETGVTVLPGVVDFLARLRAAGVPCCIGSSTERENIEIICARTGLREWFAGAVAADDVTHGKPHPEVFLKAAARIGREPHHCVVLEDAFSGLEAARAGGMRAIGVATTHPADALRPHCDRVVARLDELQVRDLLDLFDA